MSVDLPGERLQECRLAGRKQGRLHPPFPDLRARLRQRHPLRQVVEMQHCAGAAHARLTVDQNGALLGLHVRKNLHYVLGLPQGWRLLVNHRDVKVSYIQFCKQFRTDRPIAR